MAWLAGWSYRKTVSITGQAGAGTDYQVDFSIGDGSGGDFNLESHCTSFPNDIQVTDNDQTTLLDHWVEDLTVDPITMWTEVADDLGSNADICIYYGKSGESSASNGITTFLLFDDFEGASIDTDKWDTYGSPTQTSGYIQCYGTAGERIVSKDTFQYKKFRSRTQLNYGGGAYAAHVGFSATYDGSGLNNAHFYVNSTTVTRARSGNASTYETTDIGDFDLAIHLWEIRWKSGEAKYYVNDVLEDTDSTYVPSIALPAYALVYRALAYVTTYWLFVAEYHDLEPVFSSAGSEEGGPSVTIPIFMHYYRNLREA